MKTQLSLPRGYNAHVSRLLAGAIVLCIVPHVHAQTVPGTDPAKPPTSPSEVERQQTLEKLRAERRAAVEAQGAEARRQRQERDGQVFVAADATVVTVLDRILNEPQNFEALSAWIANKGREAIPVLRQQENGSWRRVWVVRGLINRIEQPGEYAKREEKFLEHFRAARAPIPGKTMPIMPVLNSKYLNQFPGPFPGFETDASIPFLMQRLALSVPRGIGVELVVEMLSRLGDGALEPLIQVAREPGDVEWQLSGLDALASVMYDDKGKVQRLLPVLLEDIEKSPHWNVRLRAVEVLGSYGTEAQAPALEKAARGEKHKIVRYAVDVLLAKWRKLPPPVLEGYP